MEDSSKDTRILDKKSEDDVKKFGLSYEVVSKPSVKRTSTSNAKRIGYPDLSRIPDFKKVKKIVLYIIVIFVIGFSSGWLGAYTRTQTTSSLTASQTKEIVSSQNQLTAAIATDVSPSVVSIQANATTTSTDIFGDTEPSQEVSEGTGIIISSSGYVVTNRHVIPAGTTSVSVTLADGTTINNVTVVGTTSSTDPLDIGFLKINNSPEQLQPALLGNSSKVQVGDSVVAIGNALGQFQNTVTSGIISGRGRTIQAGDSSSTVSEDLQDLFQTDAAINEGNSGGPLVNNNGEVIGINTALASNGAQNIGFSIPINDVEGLIKGVLSTGKIERPYLGVYYETITPSVEKQYNLGVANGAYVQQSENGQPSVLPGSPAANGGLQAGDVITAVNGVQINTNNTLSSLIDENQVGANITLTILRSGNTKTLYVTVGAEPASVAN